MTEFEKQSEMAREIFIKLQPIFAEDTKHLNAATKEGVLSNLFCIIFGSFAELTSIANSEKPSASGLKILATINVCYEIKREQMDESYAEWLQKCAEDLREVPPPPNVIDLRQRREAGKSGPRPEGLPDAS